MKATWKIFLWLNRPPDTSLSIPYQCVECQHVADLPCGQLIGASLVGITGDNWLVFDPPGFEPPENWLPSEIQCRACGCKLVSKGLAEEAEETKAKE